MAAAQVASADFPAGRSPFWFAVWIAAVAGLLPQVRYRTDQLDAVGNTTAAIGKVRLTSSLQRHILMVLVETV